MVPGDWRSDRPVLTAARAVDRFLPLRIFTGLLLVAWDATREADHGWPPAAARAYVASTASSSGHCSRYALTNSVETKGDRP